MRLLITAVLAMIVVASPASAINKKNVVGPEQCVECHKSEGRSWQGTHHFGVFRKFHKGKETKKIAKAMGIKRIKKKSLCLDCHYTVNPKNKPIAGVSCESCHGAGKNWIDVHSDYGGKNAKKENESAAHKKSRIKKSIAAGMIRPDDVYSVAQNCFQCHTVPNEKLVEQGGHVAGSDFELVSWSQGEVRHNYLADPEKNRETSANHKRMLFIVGRVLDLEYGIRGVAQVTKVTNYAKEMAKRTKKATAYVKLIADKTGNASIKSILGIAKAAKLKPNNKSALLSAAKKISGIAKKFSKSNDGSKFASVDSLIPKEYIGKAK